MAYVMLVVGIGVVWWGARAGEQAGAARVQRIGIALTAVGVLWTAFAWWLVVPELILIAGLLVLAVGSMQRRRSLPNHP